MSAQYPTLIALPMPILTPRLLIRPPEAGDGPAYHAAINASRESLQRYLDWVDVSHHSQEDSESFAREAQARFLLRKDIVLALFDRTSKELIGGSGFHRIDWTLPRFEIGYWVRTDRQGQGLIGEAVHAITRYAFEQLQAKRVEIRCETDNRRSFAVAERLGFTLDGILHHDRLKYRSQELTGTRIYSRLNTTGLPDLAVSW